MKVRIYDLEDLQIRFYSTPLYTSEHGAETSLTYNRIEHIYTCRDNNEVRKLYIPFDERNNRLLMSEAIKERTETINGEIVVHWDWKNRSNWKLKVKR